MKPLAERFWSKVVKIPFHGCWEWIGQPMKVGYGYISDEKGEDSYAHRVSWRLHRGGIPDGLCVLHKCDNRLCVNPDHLFLGTRTENQADAASKGRMPRGDKHWNVKMSDRDVEEARMLLLRGETHANIAQRFGVSRQAITNISLGRRRRVASKEVVPS